MADETTSATLPVGSASLQAEMQAAFARIVAVPAGRTLLDEIDSEHWHDGDEGCIEAGNVAHDDDELDGYDCEFKKIA